MTHGIYWGEPFNPKDVEISELQKDIQNKVVEIDILKESVIQSWKKQVQWLEFYGAKLKSHRYYLFYNSHTDGFAFGMWDDNFDFPATHYVLITNLPRP